MADNTSVKGRPTMRAKVYVIHCPEIPGRRELTAAHLAAQGVTAHWWRAVHGRSWGAASALTYDHDAPGSGYRISPGHVGNTLGHYLLWQHLYVAGVPEAVVFEDDVVVPGDFVTRYARIRQELPRSWQFAYLGMTEDDVRVGPKITARYAAGIVRLREPFGIHAYALRGSALPVLLDRMAELRAPADIQLWQNVLSHGLLDWYAAHPAIVTQRTQGAVGLVPNEWLTTLT